MGRLLSGVYNSGAEQLSVHCALFILSWGLSKLLHVNYLEQCLGHGNHSINVSLLLLLLLLLKGNDS